MTIADRRTSFRVFTWRRLRAGILLFALFATSVFSFAAQAPQQTYPTPEAGVAALVAAVRTGDQEKLSAIFGSHGSKLIRSGDTVADERGRAAFLKAYEEANRLVPQGSAKVVLVIGKDSWPFPIPLVRRNNGWTFDTKQGEQEILDRRIGRNELAAIQVCLAIVDAEREYAAAHVDGDRMPEYASRIVSTPGKQDGLYWPTEPNEKPSPLGPLVAAAANEGYASRQAQVLAPYHGYIYRILAAQGNDAPGGAYDYFIKGKMIGGFAVVAYPARYGASGIKTFIVNNDGVVFENDLGPETGSVAPKLSAYNPDPTWTAVNTTQENISGGTAPRH